MPIQIQIHCLTTVADAIPTSHIIIRSAESGGITISFNGWDLINHVAHFIYDQEIHQEIEQLGNGLILQNHPEGLLTSVTDCYLIIDLLTAQLRLLHYTHRLANWGGISPFVCSFL